MHKDDKMLKIDNCDEAVIGIVEFWEGNSRKKLICYDYLKLIECTRNNSKPMMSYEEAMEFVDFNIVSAYVGEFTPAIMYPNTLEEIEEELDNE